MSENKPTSSSTSALERAIDKMAGTTLDMKEVPKEERLANLSDAQKAELQEIIDRVIRDHSGQIDEMESALGMLLIGHHYGWKVLHLIHSKKTIRKYEDILGIKVREFFPERGPSSARSIGLAFADKATNFWRVVSGDIKIPDGQRREVK